MSHSISRRQFVKRSAAAAATISLPMFLSSRAFGANEEIRMAMVGCGGRHARTHWPASEGRKGCGWHWFAIRIAFA